MPHMVWCHLTFFLSLAILTSANVDTRLPRPDSCPVITISSRSGGQCDSHTYAFTANISGGDPTKEPTYKWSVSAGRITKGQGTSSIEIDASGVAGDIEVRMEVGGIQPKGCPNPETVSHKTECHNQ